MSWKYQGDESLKKNSKMAISKIPVAFVSKWVFMQNYLYENVFALQVYFHADHTHFHLKGIVRRLVLKQSLNELGNGLIFEHK